MIKYIAFGESVDLDDVAELKKYKIKIYKYAWHSIENKWKVYMWFFDEINCFDEELLERILIEKYSNEFRVRSTYEIVSVDDVSI